jgi:hypothetical protein
MNEFDNPGKLKAERRRERACVCGPAQNRVSVAAGASLDGCQV